MIVSSAGAGQVFEGGLAKFRPPAAAIFQQKGKKAPHSLHIGKVPDRTALARIPDQTGIQQDRKVGRHGILPDHQRVRDLTGKHTIGSGLHQKTEYIEPGILAQRGQSGESVILVHKSRMLDISI